MSFPFLGHGVGLRVPHYARALAEGVDVDWVEVITENFFGGGGRPRAVLERVRREVPIVFHGVSLSIGSAGGLSEPYLQKLAELARDFEPAWLSDHACWSRLGERHSHELLPLPYTEEALAVVCGNVQRVQEHLRRPILLENVSSYVAFRASRIPEWEFLSEIVARTGCGLLLDLNNIIVSAFNHGFSAPEYLDRLPRGAVHQFHLANHRELETHLFDDHRGPVPDAVWELYTAAIARFGRVSSLIEWDEDIPAWEVLRAEQRKAAELMLAVNPAEPRRGDEPLASRATEEASGERCAPGASPLAELQALFLDAIAWPTGVADFLERSGAATRRRFDATFAASAELDAVSRLNIYADSYFYRLLGALREMFPRLAALASDAVFHDLITDYVLAHPPRQPNLRRLADGLPDYLACHAAGLKRPLLVDVARVEQALCRALDCEGGASATESDLRAIPVERWPELSFALSPPSTLIAVEFDLEPLAAPGAAPCELALPPLPEAGHVLVGRRGLRVYFRRASAFEAAALAAFQRGCRLAEVCAELAQKSPDFHPSAMVDGLRRWLADGVIERRVR